MKAGLNRAWSLAIAQGLLVALLTFGLLSGKLPLGLEGEWVWLRVPFAPGWVDLLVSSLAAVAYVAFCVTGMRFLRRRSPSRVREGIAVFLLTGAAIVVQVAVQLGAPYGYGLTKWVTLAMHGASGYHEIAVEQVDDLGRFWADYPRWVQDQDALHIGTHPPGLIVVASALNRWMEIHAGLAQAVLRWTPESVARGFPEIIGPLPQSERAAIVLMALATLLACAATVVPVYALARASLPASGAWAAACLWPIVPSAILFQPTADTAYPVLSAAALALASRAVKPGAPGACWAIASGVVLAIGMQFTLAFLAIGFVVFLVLLIQPLRVQGEAPGGTHGWRFRAWAVGFVGLGFLALTLGIWAASSANPFEIWWWNQVNHSRFYSEYPRSYLGWALINPLELAIGIGLPTALWITLGIAGRSRESIVSACALGTLALLTLSGRNLSEVARLWLPFMPLLLVAAGAAIHPREPVGKLLAITLLLVMIQTLVLQSTLQVVYPV